MLKQFTSVLLFVAIISIAKEAKANWQGKQHNVLARLMNQISIRNQLEETCTDHIDCPEGFMCNYNDCVAKKKEGSLCLSGKDIECKCGKCTLDEENWTYVCLNEDADSCVDDGVTKLNDCSNNSDCPEEFFCDKLNDNLCTSKYKTGRMCHSDDQCKLKHCKQFNIYTRKGHLQPLAYKTCNI